MDSAVQKKTLFTRIGLGTAQFGLDYGATNAGGRLSEETAAKILCRAEGVGITFLDTAPAYGSSEAILGTLASSSSFTIGTKTPCVFADPQDIRRGLENSLRKLRRDAVDLLLVHHSGLLLGENGGKYWEALQQCKADSLVKKIGLSLYDVSETAELVSRYAPDAVQIPLNPLDQRFLRSGIFEMLDKENVEVYVRSVFLQGTLLASLENLPSFLPKAPFRSWHELCRHHGWNPLKACLGFVLGIPSVKKILCGVTSLEELESLVQNACMLPPEVFASCHQEDSFVRDPRMWP